VRITTLLRVSAAPRAALLLFPWLIFYSDSVADWIVVGYWESVTAQSGFLVGFIAPACAACAAWEGARLRASLVLDGTPVRSSLTIAVWSLAPVFVLGASAVALALMLQARLAWGYPGIPSVDLLLLQLLVIASHIAVGHVLGRILPMVAALPTALIGSFLWLAYPASLTTFWVRQLNGQNLTECCALNQVAHGRALLAPTLVAAGVLAGFLVLHLARHTWTRLLAAVPLCLALVAGAQIAAPLGYAAAKDRDRDELICSGDTPVVCLWPEQRAEAVMIHTWGSDAGRRLAEAGVMLENAVTFATVKPTEDEVRFLVAGSAMTDVYPACAERVPWQGGDALAPLMGWLALTAGVDPAGLLGGMSAEEEELAGAVRELPQAAQTEWFRTNLAALRQCDTPPPLDPAYFVDAAAAPPARS
jgi:hypothetical protein